MINEAPEEVGNIVNDIVLATMYNKRVGSSLTHKDVNRWGLIEKTAVFAALDLIGM